MNFNENNMKNLMLKNINNYKIKSNLMIKM